MQATAVSLAFHLMMHNNLVDCAVKKPVLLVEFISHHNYCIIYRHGYFQLCNPDIPLPSCSIRYVQLWISMRCRSWFQQCLLSDHFSSESSIWAMVCCTAASCSLPIGIAPYHPMKPIPMRAVMILNTKATIPLAVNPSGM